MVVLKQVVCEFEVSLGYKVRLSQNKMKKKLNYKAF
jgi:hypothetical protein